MDSFTLSQLKNKLKRLVIEFHHHKNNTSCNGRVLHNPDLSKPLLSLRVPPATPENNESPETIFQDQFKEFADLEDIEEGVEEHSYHRHESAVAKVQRGLMGVLRPYILGRLDSRVQSQSCHCVCHEYTETIDNPRSIYYHLEGCEKACHLTEDETNAGLSRDIIAQLMREGVHYIEIEEKPKKKRFLLLRSLFPSVHIPKIYSGKTKENTTMSSTTTTTTPTSTNNTGLVNHELDEERDTVPGDDQLQIQVRSATIGDGTTDECQTLGPIEIIALSTEASAECHGEHVNDNSNGYNYMDEVTPNAIPFHVKDEMKSSSYSRRQQKPTPSMISLVKVDPDTAQEKRLQRPPESWKVVMNEVSLHAALISTGARPPQQSKSSLNLVADFTSSKHQLKHGKKYHHYPNMTQQRFFSNETITDEYFQKYHEHEPRILREKSMEEDLLDMSTIAGPKAKENMGSLSYCSINTTTQQIHSLLHSHSHGQSILSELLVSTESFHSYEDGEGDETYDMLLAYNYSDDEGETKPVLPLNIRAAKRIF